MKMHRWLVISTLALGICSTTTYAQRAGGGGAGGLGGGGAGFGGAGGGLGGGQGFGGGQGGGFGGGQGGTAGRGGTTNATNFLAATYSNPLYSGRPGVQIQTPGAATGAQSIEQNNNNRAITGEGFGQSSFGSSGTTGGTGGFGGGGTTGGFGGGTGGGTGGTVSFGGGTTGGTGGFGGGRTGGTTGFGGTNALGGGGAGRTGFGGAGGATGFGGGATGGLGGGRAGGVGGAGSTQMAGGPNVITYTATFRFTPKVPQIPQIVTDLQAMLQRSTTISNPAGIRIEEANGAILLTGRAANDDERRLIEGMIRLTPGVRQIRNQITVP
ncbi:MAG: BON domain-containing protein [Zavarzinella sp.]